MPGLVTRAEGARLGSVPVPGRRSSGRVHHHHGLILPRLLQAFSVGFAGISIAGLGACHLLLLWQRVADLSLFQPVVALRWLLSVGLMAGLLWLQRTGQPLVRSRRAMILWLLVLVLHLCFLGPLADGEGAGPVADLLESSRDLALVLPGAVLLPTLLVLSVVGLAGTGGRVAGMPGPSAPRGQSGFDAARQPPLLSLLLGRPPPLVPISVS